MGKIDWTYLGVVDYELAMRIQYAHARRVGIGFTPRLFLMQHPPTVTLGRQADSSNLLLAEREYQSRGIKVIHAKRGGDVTYHGPGQLVGYPVVSLDMLRISVPEWVKSNAQAIVRFLEHHGVSSAWSDRHPGVWVDRKKIAAVGFHISKRISTHGIALNLDPDLTHFETIVPCGLRQLGTTSMADLEIKPPAMQAAAEELAFLLAERLGQRLGEYLDARRIFEESLNEEAIISVA